jgi:hypothetical protein
MIHLLYATCSAGDTTGFGHRCQYGALVKEAYDVCGVHRSLTTGDTMDPKLSDVIKVLLLVLVCAALIAAVYAFVLIPEVGGVVLTKKQ